MNDAYWDMVSELPPEFLSEDAYHEMLDSEEEEERFFEERVKPIQDLIDCIREQSRPKYKHPNPSVIDKQYLELDRLIIDLGNDLHLMSIPIDRSRSATSAEKVLDKKLIKIFQDVIDNRCFELGYNEIQGILLELRQQEREG